MSKHTSSAGPVGDHGLHVEHYVRKGFVIFALMALVFIAAGFALIA